VAALTGSEIRGVKCQRSALGEFRVLPLVINGEGADELVLVQRIREVGLMAGGAEFRRPIERLHDRLGVTLGMLEDVAKGNLARDTLAVFVYHHRRDAHHIAAIAGGGLQPLDRVTGGTGQAVLVKGAVDVGVRCEAAREYDDRIVAAIAVPRELDAFGADEDVYARPVERRAEGVGVECLTPLMVSLVMAMAAVFRLWKSAWLNEHVALGSGIAGKRHVVFAEEKVIRLSDLVGIVFAVGVFAGLGVRGELNRSHQQDHTNREGCGSQENSIRSRLHDDLSKLSQFLASAAGFLRDVPNMRYPAKGLRCGQFVSYGAKWLCTLYNASRAFCKWRHFCWQPGPLVNPQLRLSLFQFVCLLPFGGGFRGFALSFQGIGKPAMRFRIGGVGAERFLEALNGVRDLPFFKQCVA
jgi:hypothetical protein